VVFQTANAEKEELKNTADKMQRQLEAAEKLINGLSSEQTRWRYTFLPLILSLNLQQWSLTRK
jgi:hypothetical protein